MVQRQRAMPVLQGQHRDGRVDLGSSQDL